MTAITSTVLSNYLQPPPSHPTPVITTSMASPNLNSFNQINNTHQFNSPNFDDPNSIDTFLSSLSLSSLQLLNTYCDQTSRHYQSNLDGQTSQISENQTLHYNNNGFNDGQNPSVNPVLLCDRFFQNYANLTNSALQFLDSGQESSDSTSFLWSSSVSSTGTTSESVLSNMLANDDVDESYLSPSKSCLVLV